MKKLICILCVVLGSGLEAYSQEVEVSETYKCKEIVHTAHKEFPFEMTLWSVEHELGFEMHSAIIFKGGELVKKMSNCRKFTIDEGFSCFAEKRFKVFLRKETLGLSATYQEHKDQEVINMSCQKETKNEKK